MPDFTIKYEIDGQPVELVVPDSTPFVDVGVFQLRSTDSAEAEHFYNALSEFSNWPVPIRRLFACVAEHECRRLSMGHPNGYAWSLRALDWHSVAEEDKEATNVR